MGRRYKRREDFTDEEWKRIVIEAWRLRAEKGWGRVKIAKALGISPNTVGCWINNHKTPTKKVIDQYENGVFQYQIIDAKRIIEDEMRKGNLSREEAEDMLSDLDFWYYLCFYYPRAKRIKKEGDDSYLIYS